MIVTFPPIRYPCYAGIDFPSQQELLAFHHREVEPKPDEDIASSIAKSLGADYVAYNDTYNLAEAIGIPENDLCFSCSNGNYSPLGIKPLFKSREQVKGEPRDDKKR
jgi:amidophosphoribosyltransferase